MALTTINSGGVKDDSIVNADIKSDAAIAGSKVAPDFGSQNIITTGTVGSGDITLTKPGSAANAKLEIAQSGGGGGTSEILFSDATSGRGRIFFNHGSNPEVLNLEAAGTIGLSVTTAGKVGIGTTSPGYKLHVAEGTTDVVASFTSSDANAWIQLRDDHTTDTAVMIGANDDSMMLRAGSNTRMLIAHNGNVGIGTESPKSFANQTSLTIDGSSVGRFDCISGGSGGGGIYGTATSTKVFANSGATLYLDTAASTDLRLSVNGTDIAKVKSNQDFEIVDGNLVVANTHGIDFSASESSNTTSSSVLSDYEEGSWTPTFNGLGNYSLYAVWRYTKIGNLVQVGGRLVVTSTTNSGSDNVTFNLPFTSAANITNSLNEAVNVALTHKINTNGDGVVGRVAANSSTVTFYKIQDDAVWDVLATDDVSVDDQLVFSLTYKAA